MLPFHYVYSPDSRIHLFTHIAEIGVKKNLSIQLHSFPEETAETLNIYFINDGRFDWRINGQAYSLYPEDTILVLPGQKFGNEKEILEIGTFSWIKLQVNKLNSGEPIPCKWSGLSKNESLAVGKLLYLNTNPVLSKLTETGRILSGIVGEINNQELGYITRVNQLTSELLVTITRHLTKQYATPRDFPKVFMQLEESLRKDLSHQWTVEEMAAIAGMGTTLFNEKVKSFTGFTPINYLINIRISEAIKMLKKNKNNITDIALDTGFYSSQHFSTTFKKLTGYTPSEFRKNNLTNE
jgi:AraC-like DNA-binding protein